jgi:hypothetical protein
MTTIRMAFLRLLLIFRKKPTLNIVDIPKLCVDITDLHAIVQHVAIPASRGGSPGFMTPRLVA